MSRPLAKPWFEQSLRHDADANQILLGCLPCRERRLCGGLAIAADCWSCLSLCCNHSESCDRVCRRNPEFAARVQEVGGFELSTPRTPTLPRPRLPLVVPDIFHGSMRKRPFAPVLASLSLYRMFDRRSGEPRFQDPQVIATAFALAEGTTFVLTGIQRDASLERWWELGRQKRRAIIMAARACGATLATSPNYSMFIDRPRWDDLHAMKRIALIHSEFLDAGLPAALHVNGRTETDFLRWADYIVHHPEVQIISYEFTTGTGRSNREGQHAKWLTGLAGNVGRPLHLVIRGGTGVLPQLCGGFAQLTFLDTNPFIKTMKRLRAIKRDRLLWWVYPTKKGEPLDDLLEMNWEASRDYLTALIRRHATPGIQEPAIA